MTQAPDGSGLLLDDYRLGFPLAHGSPFSSAVLRQHNTDFRVTEHLSFEPTGEGDHLYLQIQKDGQNTDFVAKELARFFEVARRDVGYAGMKDRNAVTLQWFSVPMPANSQIGIDDLKLEGCEILQVTRHGKKLKTGALRGNSFSLILRSIAADPQEVEQRLGLLQKSGVPNYFGEQRFGHAGHNLLRAEEMLLRQKKIRDRHQRGLYLSSARSLIFNRVLAERISAGTWNRALPGDAMMFADGHSFFVVPQPDDETVARVAEGSLSPTGPLAGRGDSPLQGESLATESRVLEHFSAVCGALAASKVDQARRALRMIPGDMHWEWLEKGVLRLEFFLYSGSYATCVLRELFSLEPALPVKEC